MTAPFARFLHSRSAAPRHARLARGPDAGVAPPDNERHMRLCTRLLLALALLWPARAAAQDPEPQSRVLATSIGALAGIVGGGYVSLTVIVAESRVGRYVHDVDDVLGWRSAPVILGTLAGAGLGFYSPERLQGAVVYGAGGLALGALAGLGIGSAIWDPPEGRWAGAAIGAGVGLVIGNAIGVLRPLNLFTREEDEEGGTVTAGIPIMFRIPL